MLGGGVDMSGPAVVWNFTQRRLVLTDVSGQPVGPLSQGLSSLIKQYKIIRGLLDTCNMRPIGSLVTSITIYQSWSA